VAREVADEALNLVATQIKLARLEISVDLRRGLEGVVRIALFVPPLIVGYAFAMAALASWLGGYCGRPAALAYVAALQLVPAAIGVARAVATLRRSRGLARTGAEIAEGFRQTLAVVSNAPRVIND
jgi:hypothetical protein